MSIVLLNLLLLEMADIRWLGRGEKKKVDCNYSAAIGGGLPKLVGSVGDGPRAGALPAVAELGNCRIKQVLIKEPGIQIVYSGL